MKFTVTFNGVTAKHSTKSFLRLCKDLSNSEIADMQISVNTFFDAKKVMEMHYDGLEAVALYLRLRIQRQAKKAKRTKGAARFYWRQSVYELERELRKVSQ